jgi:hypothetical protein
MTPNLKATLGINPFPLHITFKVFKIYIIFENTSQHEIFVISWKTILLITCRLFTIWIRKPFVLKTWVKIIIFVFENTSAHKRFVFQFKNLSIDHMHTFSAIWIANHLCFMLEIPFPISLRYFGGLCTLGLLPLNL